MRFSVLFLFTFLCLVAGQVLAQDQDTFSLGDGRFEISGKKPAAFTQVRYLYLEGPVLKAASGRRLLPQSSARVTGEVYGKQKFKIKTAGLDGETIEFETVVVKGVSFKFSGKVSNFYPDDQKVISPQLRGTLTKLVNGRKSAEALVTFVHLEPEF